MGKRFEKSGASQPERVDATGFVVRKKKMVIRPSVIAAAVAFLIGVVSLSFAIILITDNNRNGAISSVQEQASDLLPDPEYTTDVDEPTDVDESIDTDDPANADESTETAVPPTDVHNAPTGKIGMFDPSFDYSANKRYKVAYLALKCKASFELFYEPALAHWASLMNVDFTGIDFADDSDKLLRQIPQICKDYDGVILDVYDETLYDRLYNLLEQSGTPWINFNTPFRADGGNGALLHPCVEIDQHYIGAMLAEHLYNQAKISWPDVPMSEFGFISVDYSTVPEFHELERGAFSKIAEIDPDMANNRYFVADYAYEAIPVSGILANRPNISHWLIHAEAENLAMEAVQNLNSSGYSDTSLVVTSFGALLVQQWDKGIQSALKSAFYFSYTIQAEPVFGALYTFMNGDATPETIFPEWKDVHESTKYGSFAKMIPPVYEIQFETYKRVLKWADIYAGTNDYPDYPSSDITRDSYPNTAQVPDSYK